MNNLIKIIFILYLFFFYNAVVSAGKVSKKDIEERLNLKYLTCRDITLNTFDLLPDLLEANQLSDADYVIKKWKDYCPYMDNVQKAEILLAIAENRFSENLYKQYIIYHIKVKERIYLNRLKQNRRDDKHYSYPLRLYDKKQKKFNQYMLHFSNKLLKKQRKDTLEYLFCKLYSNDYVYFFNELAKEKYRYSNLFHYYQKYIMIKRNKLKANIAFLSGLWVPTGNLSIFGNHPTLGIRLGFSTGNFTSNFTIMPKILESKNSYITHNKYGQTVSTNNFEGIYIGLDFDYKLKRYKRYFFSILGGFAYDAITAFAGDENKNNAVIFGTFNKNIGFGIGYYFSKKEKGYIKLENRYNFVNYNNPYGTDISGNFFSFFLVFGIRSNKI